MSGKDFIQEMFNAVLGAGPVDVVDCIPETREESGSWVDENGEKWCGCGDAIPKELAICVNCQYVEDMITEDNMKHKDVRETDK